MMKTSHVTLLLENVIQSERFMSEKRITESHTCILLITTVQEYLLDHQS